MHMIHMALRATTAVGTLALTVACSGSMGASANGAASASPALTDANIAAIVVAANNADISYANIAVTKTSNADVKEFAQAMINAHSGLNKTAVELVTRLQVTPVDHEISAGLRDKALETRAMLEGKSGASFDKAYIDNEVTYHRMVLATIDTALIPGAKNAELKALLVRVRPAIAAHLEHATMIQTKMGSP